MSDKRLDDFEAVVREFDIEGKAVIIGQRAPSICETCGEEKETRPYGPDGENVCFQCGMKDEAAAKRAFGKLLGLAEKK